MGGVDRFYVSHSLYLLFLCFFNFVFYFSSLNIFLSFFNSSTGTQPKSTVKNYIFTACSSHVMTSAATIFSLGFKLSHFSSFSPVTDMEQPVESMIVFILRLRSSMKEISSIQTWTPWYWLYSRIRPKTSLLTARWGVLHSLSGTLL